MRLQKPFVNSSLGDIKLSKTQMYKMTHFEGLLPLKFILSSVKAIGNIIPNSAENRFNNELPLETSIREFGKNEI